MNGQSFEPIRTLVELETLDHDEVVRGYMETEKGDPEPGPNRGRSYWHGWRNRMIDLREIEPDGASRQLAHEYVKRTKKQ